MTGDSARGGCSPSRALSHSAQAASGSQDDVEQLFKIVHTTAHYTSRTLLRPSHATFLNLPSHSIPHRTRRISSSFSVPHIAEPLHVPIVEPRYPAWAARRLVSGSVLANASAPGGRLKANVRWPKGPWPRRCKKVAELGEVVELDMRHMRTLAALLSLLGSPAFSTARAPVIKLMDYDRPSPSVSS